MIVKNLLSEPRQLGDSRMIGAAGTGSSSREYGLPELTVRDKGRVDRNELEVVKETSDEPEKPAEDKTTKPGGKK
jgi:hypothetical protein